MLVALLFGMSPIAIDSNYRGFAQLELTVMGHSNRVKIEPQPYPDEVAQEQGLAPNRLPARSLWTWRTQSTGEHKNAI